MVRGQRRWAVSMCLALTAFSAVAQQHTPLRVGVAVFNMAWAGTRSDYVEHYRLCSSESVNWCSTRAGSRYAGKLAGARAAQCRAAVNEQAGGAARAMLIAPCNAYRPLGRRHTLEYALGQYDKKLQGLAATVDTLITNHGVRVLAFQEVKSVAAINVVLGRHAAAYAVCAALHGGFQTLGFAWDRRLGARPDACSARPQLAVPEQPESQASLRSVRPGLALRLNINGAPVSFLNVHLKSGCANLVSDARFRGHLLTDPIPACRLLNRQIPKLEQWIESVSLDTPRFVLLGDFNRRIDQEAALQVAPGQVRASGADPSSPHMPDEAGAVASRYLWQEIADNTPVPSAMVQVRLDAAGAACGGYAGLDHIVVSRAIADAQTRPLTSTKIAPVRMQGQVLPTSDHCPRLVELDL